MLASEHGCMLRRIPLLLLAMSLVFQACSNPVTSNSSRKVFFSNLTDVAFQVKTQSDRLQIPVESLVASGDTADIGMASFEPHNHLSITLVPQALGKRQLSYPDVSIEIEFNGEGMIDVNDANTVSLTALDKSGTVDESNTTALWGNRTSFRDTSLVLPLLIEADSLQDSLRINFRLKGS